MLTKLFSLAEKNEKIIFFSIYVIGLVLRLFELDSKSLWLDEFYTLEYISSLKENILRGGPIINNNHPPLYFTILYILLFKKTIFLFRLPSAVFGALAIFFVYKLSYRGFGYRTAILSASLLALSPLHISYSQFARNTTLLILLSLTSVYFLLEVLENGKREKWIGFILSNILLIYTHYVGFFILLLETFYLFLRSKRKRETIFSVGFILLTYMPWLYLLYINIVRLSPIALGYFYTAPPFVQEPSLIHITHMFYKYSIGLRRLSLIDWRIITVLVAPIFGFLFFYGVYNAIKNRRGNVDLLISYLIILPLLIYFASFYKINLFFFRYLIFMLPVYLIFIANGISSIKNKKIAALMVISIFILYTYLLYDYYFLIDKNDWYNNVGL